MATKNDVTQKQLQEMLDYDKDTGIFKWKDNVKGVGGKIAGYTNSKGYVFIRIKNKLYRAHRLAWIYEYGEISDKEIDHIDNNPNNNKINNLRLCTSSENKQNMKKRKDNTSGVKGLHWYKAYNKWQVNLTKNKKTKCYGYFDDLFEACCVLFSNRNSLHGEFANHGY